MGKLPYAGMKSAGVAADVASPSCLAASLTRERLQMTSANPLDRVLSCPGLPTLPAVAIQVLELTRDPNVTVTQLARLVQADPSLSAKVLRTVNSSFFALPQACSKIDRALALLGLNTIKSLVLGFTLMEGTRGVPGDTGLDLTRHWRRALYSAAAARHVAVATGLCDPDEAFTAAMLQDIGMLACIVAIPEEYAPVILPSLKDHEPLPRAEQAALGFDHAHVGAALARKWRLPEHLAAAIAHHHAPEGAPAALQPLARTTWLGMLIAESLGGRVIEVTHEAQPRIVWEYFNVAGEIDGKPAVGVVTHAERFRPDQLPFLQEPVS